MIEAKQLNLLLSQNIDGFLAFLYGSNPAYEKGGVWSMGNVKGGPGESLKIWSNGSFKDFASGDQGDLVNLATMALGTSFPDTCRAIERFLGIDSGGQESMAEIDKGMDALQAKSIAEAPKKPTPGIQWKPHPPGDPWREQKIPTATTPDHTWTYHTKDGVPIFIVGRWNASGSRKKFFQIASYREGGWVAKAPDISLWPLLDEPQLLMYPKDRLTVLVEGEKAAEWGKRHLPQFFWTTWHGGSGSVKRTDFISLADRLVILWPDNDVHGMEAMSYVHTQLPDALMVQCKDEWPDKADVADLTDEEVLEVLNNLLVQGKEVEAIVKQEEESRTVTDEHTEPNQLGSVYRFLDRYGKDMRFLTESRNWVYWDGRRWATDRGGYSWTRAVDTVERAFTDCMPWTSGDSKKLTRVENYVQSAKTTSHIKGVVEGSSLMPGVPVTETAFDLDPDMINCVNGMVDLRTGKVFPHSRDAMMSKLVQHRYEPGAQAPMFMDFMKEIMCGDQELVDFLQVYFGYGLTGLPPDRIFAIFYGSGRNGKSTLIQIISEILGDYHVTIRSQSIMSGKDGDRPDKIGEDLIPLRGARLCTMQESDRSSKLNEGKIKEMTGRDMMRCRYLHSNLWLAFVNTSKMILTTNHRPRVTGQDPGIWDRIAMVPFEARIPEEKIDPDLSSKILEAEAEGVLAWMVAGAIKFYAAGKKVVRPKAVINSTDEYRSDEDMLGKFVEATMTSATLGRVKVSTLMEVYKRWMTANGDQNAILGSRRFAEDIRNVMERNGYQRRKTADGTFYFGCSLLDDEQAEALAAARGDLPSHWSEPRESGVRNDIY